MKAGGKIPAFCITKPDISGFTLLLSRYGEYAGIICKQIELLGIKTNEGE